MLQQNNRNQTMKRLALIAVLAAAACSPKAEESAAIAPPTPPAESAQPPSPAVTLDVLTADGIGPLRIGMTKDEVIAAVGDTRTPDAAGIPGECIEFQPQRAPDGVWVMIEEGKLTRITLGDLSTVKTDRGFGLGDTPDAVKAAYGLPEGFEPFTAVAIGHPTSRAVLPPDLKQAEVAPRVRKGFDEFVFAGGWGKASGLF